MTPEQEALREKVARMIASDCHDERCYGALDHYETADAAIAVVLKEAARKVAPKKVTPPCDCVETFENGTMLPRCYCSNRGDGADVVSWCTDANNATAILSLIPQEKPRT